MWPRQLIASVLALLLLPIVASAQTARIEREVEARLWFYRALAWVEDVTGAPPAVAIATFLTVFVAFLAAVWLWRARRKAADK